MNSLRPGVLILVGLVLLGGLGTLILPPGASQRVELTREVQAKRLMVAQLQAQLGQLGAINQARQALSLYSQRLDQRVPQESAQADLFVQIRAGASARGLRLTALNPKDPVLDEAWYRLPVTVTVQGDYRGLMGFLTGLTQMPRAVRIDSVEILPQGSTLEMRVQISSFFRGGGGK